MLKLFRRRAGLFVAFGWLLFVASIPICLAIRFGAAFDAFYFPAHRGASLDVFDIKATSFALLAGVLAVAASSIALALKFRVAASIMVVAIWSIVIFGTQGARLLVKPGPEYFERHIGQQTFDVPWLYSPDRPGSAAEDPHAIGLSVKLCLSNLRGRYDQDCLRQFRQLQVFPKEENVFDFEVEFWRRRSSEMSPAGEHEGYQSYTYSFQGGSPTHVSRYLLRRDAGGRLTRLVVCRQNTDEFCSHHALAGNYWLIYDAALTDGETLDGKLAGLVESWRRK